MFQLSWTVGGLIDSLLCSAKHHEGDGLTYIFLKKIKGTKNVFFVADMIDAYVKEVQTRPGASYNSALKL